MQIKHLSFSEERQEHFLQYSKGFILILSMVLLSLMVGNKEVILPELAALSIGTLVYMKKEWRTKPWDLFKLPTITATIGFFVNQFNIPVVGKLILTFLGMMIVLAAAKNFLAPALATGLLPVITNCSSWEFMLAIVVFTFILALCIHLRRHKAILEPAEEEEVRSTDFFLYLSVIIGWFSICFYTGRMEMAAIPPVIVVALESMGSKQLSVGTWSKQVLTLTLSAFIGATAITFFADHILIGAALSILGVSLLLALFQFKLPPAFAMGLLPLVLPAQQPLIFTVNVLLMALAVLGSVYLLKNIRLKTSRHH
ncbi:MAG: hypothetical protein ACTHZ1_12215 [Sphingobacterium sp.]